MRSSCRRASAAPGRQSRPPASTTRSSRAASDRAPLKRRDSGGARRLRGRGVRGAVLLCPEGAALVNVPDPARFALHKLIVHAERTGTFRAKSNKDLVQAAHLPAYLWEFRRDQLLEAHEQLSSRGKGWAARLKQGLLALNRAYPSFAAGEHFV